MNLLKNGMKICFMLILIRVNLVEVLADAMPELVLRYKGAGLFSESDLCFLEQLLL